MAMNQDNHIDINYGFKEEINPNFGYVCDMKEALELVKNYELNTASKFSIIKSAKHFGNADWQNKSHRIIFHTNRGEDQIPFDGIPFMVLGHKILQCQYGKDHHKTDKEKYKAKIEQCAIYISTGEFIPPKKRRHLANPTIKMDCPARILQREVLAFPDYKIMKNTERLRKESSKKLRQDLASNPNRVKSEKRIYLSLPLFDDHKFHIPGEDVRQNRKKMGKLDKSSSSRIAMEQAANVGAECRRINKEIECYTSLVCDWTILHEVRIRLEETLKLLKSKSNVT